jgi:hypothetical protein
MTNTAIMCRQHLIAEHLECSSMCLGILKRKHKIDGYIKSNAIEIVSSKARHDEIVTEMLSRKYNHNSPFEGIPQDLLDYYKIECQFKVNRNKSLQLLLIRCPDCKERYDKLFPDMPYEVIAYDRIENFAAYSSII